MENRLPNLSLSGDSDGLEATPASGFSSPSTPGGIIREGIAGKKTLPFSPPASQGGWEEDGAL